MSSSRVAYQDPPTSISATTLFIRSWIAGDLGGFLAACYWLEKRCALRWSPRVRLLLWVARRACPGVPSLHCQEAEWQLCQGNPRAAERLARKGLRMVRRVRSQEGQLARVAPRFAVGANVLANTDAIRLLTEESEATLFFVLAGARLEAGDSAAALEALQSYLRLESDRAHAATMISLLIDGAERRGSVSAGLRAQLSGLLR